MNSFLPRGRDFPKPLPGLVPILLQQGLQVGEQSRTLLRVPKTKLDAGGNKAGGIAEIMANAIMDHNVDGWPSEMRRAMALVSCTSPPLPGVIRRRAPKIARSKRWHPVATKFDDAS